MRRMRWLAVGIAAATLLAGCTGGGIGSGTRASTGPSVAIPTATAVSTVLPPAATPAPSTPVVPSASASITPVEPSASAPCATSWDVAPSVSSAEPAQLTDVRVGARDEGDRIVFEFAGDVVPAFDITPAEPPFVQDASGLPVEVPGRAFLRIHFPFATGMEAYDGPAALAGQGALLVSLVRTGDFEAVLTWVAGTDRPACVRVTTLQAPTRVVLDLAPAD